MSNDLARSRQNVQIALDARAAMPHPYAKNPADVSVDLSGEARGADTEAPQAMSRNSREQTVENGEKPAPPDGWTFGCAGASIAPANIFKIQSIKVLETRKTTHDQGLAQGLPSGDLCLDEDRPQMLDACALLRAPSPFSTA